jgi:flagellar hook-basal body complex protein FliE
MAIPLGPTSAFAQTLTFDLIRPIGAVQVEKVAVGFGEALREAGNAFATNLAEADRVALQSVTGKTDARQVVEAVLTAEQSLHAAMAIRDKIVSAYLEISRMSI